MPVGEQNEIDPIIKSFVLEKYASAMLHKELVPCTAGVILMLQNLDNLFLNLFQSEE